MPRDHDQVSHRWMGHQLPKWSSERAFMELVAIELDAVYDRLGKILEALGGSTGEAVSVSFEKGQTMNLTVDSGTFSNTLVFKDDKGDVASPPAGATVVYSLDNTELGSVAADANDPFTVDGTLAGVEGTGTVTAAVSNADGSAFGTAAFGIDVGAGAATTVGFANP